jgi:ADP-ribosylglycohydrolase
MFHRWLDSNSIAPYNSFGNGSAIRVSPVGFAFKSLDMVLQKAEESAAVTRNQPEGIKGAQAIATAT